jgi:hypothetical protein
VEHQRTRKAEETFQVPGGLGRCNLLSVRELSPDDSGRFERRLESMPTNFQLSSCPIEGRQGLEPSSSKPTSQN